MMPDLNKVIAGLEHCRKYGPLGGHDCSGHYKFTDNMLAIEKVGEHRHDCPYGKCKTGCVVTLVENAVALLKAQTKTPVVFNQVDGSIESVCGNCGCDLDKAYSTCPQCKKELDWDA